MHDTHKTRWNPRSAVAGRRAAATATVPTRPADRTGGACQGGFRMRAGYHGGMSDPLPSAPPARPAPPAAAASRRGRGLTHDVVQGLTERLRSGEIGVGDKLPSEAEIMRAFGVSRGVVREALSRLQAARLVETHHGIGTFALAVADTGPWPAAGAAPGAATGGLDDVLAVLELRLCVESESAALAALRRTPAQLDGMRRAVADFARHPANPGGTVAPDFRFHQAIADATGNPYVAGLMHQLGPRVIPRSRLPATLLPPQAQAAHLLQVHAEHEQVLDAIARGDADAARAAMRVHLVNSRERQHRAARRSDGDVAAGPVRSPSPAG